MSEKPTFPKHAQVRRKGLTYDEFELDRVIDHHWGRTIGETESVMFSTMTLNFNPTYFNVEYAKALGYDRMPLNPYLIYLTIFGLSVEDLTEGGQVGALVGMEQVKFHQPGFPCDTFFARSTVLAKRASSKNPEMGIVTWLTEGFNQHGLRVVEYQRTNMMNIRS